MCNKYHTLCPYCNRKIVVEIQGINQIDLTMTKVKKGERIIKEYYHKLPKQRVEELFATDSKMTWNDLMIVYSQPDWCRLFHALNYMEGCWSLIYYHVKEEKDCLSCEDYRKQ